MVILVSYVEKLVRWSNCEQKYFEIGVKHLTSKEISLTSGKEEKNEAFLMKFVEEPTKMKVASIKKVSLFRLYVFI